MNEDNDDNDDNDGGDDDSWWDLQVPHYDTIHHSPHYHILTELGNNIQKKEPMEAST